ncbi:hypothetical protein CAPTEDRAFT_146525 [Capitella teleta]|uniref:Alpha/beta hydrolase fold-3 domain-containing protein n=1 Tax=Capitella teleta TaxID=283909 RepID=R7U5G6_CAPTE|nr:hypothetical protein CAPTEDRAFT_146525 [Capitella teleta]|eukprot:ELT98931.1 hypothetical protein CAPTEDRAFT_146525 [Capitella teleta]
MAKLFSSFVSAAEIIGVGLDTIQLNRAFVNGYLYALGIYNGYGEGYPVRTEYSEVDGVPVVIYRPLTDRGLRPALVYFHGGGWVMARAWSQFSLHKHLAGELDIIVISVDYRRAPVFRYPVPFEDCVRATKYILAHGEKLGVHSTRVALAGDSAGGNLAAAVSAKLRDEKFTPRNKLQVLIYPALQACDLATPSYQQQKFDRIVMAPEVMAWYWSIYVTGNHSLAEALLRGNHTSIKMKQELATGKLNHDLIPNHLKFAPYSVPDISHGSDVIWDSIREVFLDPYFAPLVADDFTDLPSTFVWTVQYDVLRDDGVLYVHHLRRAGNQVEHLHTEGGWHPMLELRFLHPQEDEAMLQIRRFIRQKL